MIRTARTTIGTGLRIALLTAVFVGPVGALAMASANQGQDGLTGAGFVLYVTLQRGS